MDAVRQEPGRTLSAHVGSGAVPGATRIPTGMAIQEKPVSRLFPVFRLCHRPMYESSPAGCNIDSSWNSGTVGTHPEMSQLAAEHGGNDVMEQRHRQLTAQGTQGVAISHEWSGAADPGQRELTKFAERRLSSMKAVGATAAIVTLHVG